MDSRLSREFAAQSVFIRAHQRRKRFAVLRVSAVDLLFLLPAEGPGVPWEPSSLSDHPGSPTSTGVALGGVEVTGSRGAATLWPLWLSAVVFDLA
jgi:hypothetical protein